MKEGKNKGYLFLENSIFFDLQGKVCDVSLGGPEKSSGSTLIYEMHRS